LQDLELVVLSEKSNRIRRHNHPERKLYGGLVALRLGLAEAQGEVKTQKAKEPLVVMLCAVSE
jgi:hypothetical protein